MSKLDGADALAQWIIELLGEHGAELGVVTVLTERPRTFGVVDTKNRKVYVVVIAKGQIEVGSP